MVLTSSRLPTYTVEVVLPLDVTCCSMRLPSPSYISAVVVLGLLGAFCHADSRPSMS
jgi:hypothetical protein